MSKTSAELVQVHPEKLKKIKFTVARVQRSYSHFHGAMELALVLTGKLRVTVKENTRTAGPGDLLLFNAFQAHRVTPEPEAEVLFLHLAPGFGKEYFTRIAAVEFAMPQILSSQARARILEPLQKAALAYFTQGPAMGFTCAGWTAHCVAALLEQIPYTLASDTEHTNKKKKVSRQQRVAAYVEEHYREKLTLIQLAQAEGVTVAYMSRLFAELFQTNFQAYLSQLRLKKAVPLLRNPAIYLVDVCMECGFSDTRYLNAVCQKQYGCTATKLRERMQDPAWVDRNTVLQEYKTCYDDQSSLAALQAFCWETSN